MIELPPELGITPGVVGVGVDVVEVARMERALERTSGFAARYFGERERATCESRHDPAASFAARFAAKEAVLKALGLGIFDVPLVQIELVGGGARPPVLELSGVAADRAADAGVGRWLVSVSHDGGIAAAVAVAVSA